VSWLDQQFADSIHIRSVLDFFYSARLQEHAQGLCPDQITGKRQRPCVDANLTILSQTCPDTGPHRSTPANTLDVTTVTYENPSRHFNGPILMKAVKTNITVCALHFF
jgi:hypothetical protein